MENQSTPIENLMSMGDDTPNEGSGMSASEQILQKYIELENQTPERKQINEGQEQRKIHITNSRWQICQNITRGKK